MTDFQIPLGTIKARKSKPQSNEEQKRIDEVADAHGFSSREPTLSESEKRGRGRPKSPRTGQVHAKVLPPIHEEIAEEAAKRGVTQGVIIEEAWALYKNNG